MESWLDLRRVAEGGLDHAAGKFSPFMTCRRVGVRGYIILGTHSRREEVEEGNALWSIMKVKAAILS